MELPLNFTTIGSLNSCQLLKLSKRDHLTPILQLTRVIRAILADRVLHKLFKLKRINMKKALILKCPRLWFLRLISNPPSLKEMNR